MLANFNTRAFSCNSVEISPFFASRTAIATGANFSIKGNGKLFLLDSNPSPSFIKSYTTQDSLYDCCWSENHENQIIASSGDGSVKLFDLTLNVPF